jgi:hypothetical protein
LLRKLPFDTTYNKLPIIRLVHITPFKMQAKTLILAALVAFTEARFGQEGLVQNAVQGLSDFGNPGEAGTLAGQTPGSLLGGANACDKVRN